MLVHPTKTGARSGEVEVTEWVSGTYAKIGCVDDSPPDEEDQG